MAAAATAADLASKHYVFRSMLADETVPKRVEQLRQSLPADRDPPSPQTILRQLNLHHRVIPGVKFTLSTNPGVVFGLSMQRWLVAVATVATIGLVLFFFASSRAKARMLHIALAFVLAGALGNLYDRLWSHVRLPGDGVIKYEVRDFIDCSGLYYPWVFNVADVLLVVGVAMLLLHSFLAERRGRKRV